MVIQKDVSVKEVARIKLNRVFHGKTAKERNTHLGKVGAMLSGMAILKYICPTILLRGAVNMFGNIALLWKNILAGIYCQANKFIIKTESKMITDWRILN